MATYTVYHYTIETQGGFPITTTRENAVQGIPVGVYYIPIITSASAITSTYENVEADNTPPNTITFIGRLTGKIACSGGGETIRLSGAENTLYPVFAEDIINTLGFSIVPGFNNNYIATIADGGTMGYLVNMWSGNSGTMVPYAPDNVDTSQNFTIPYSSGSYGLTQHTSGDTTFYTINIGFSIQKEREANGNSTFKIPVYNLADTAHAYYINVDAKYRLASSGNYESVFGEVSLRTDLYASYTSFIPVQKDGESNTISPYQFFLGDPLSYVAPASTTTGGNSSGENADDASDINNAGSRNPYQKNNGITANIGDDTGNKGGDGTFETGGNSTTADDTAGQTYIYSTDDSGTETKTLGSITGIDALGGGLYIYKMTESITQQLISKLWDSTAYDAIVKYLTGGTASTILRIYQSPFEADSDGGKNIFLGGYDTEIFSPVAHQYKLNTLVAEFDWDEFFGSFMDYEARYAIWLPFVGFRDLSPDDYVGAHVKIYRSLDFLNGTIVYNIQTNTTATKSESYTRTAEAITDTFSGSMASDIPFSASSMANAISSTLGIVQAATSTLTGLVSGNAAAALSGLAGTAVGIGTNALAGTKREFSAHGSSGGSIGLMQSLHIYILAYRPVQAVAAEKPHYIGYTSRSYISALSNLGENVFVKMNAALLGSAIPDDYKEDILAQLKEGVYT